MTKKKRTLDDVLEEARAIAVRDNVALLLCVDSKGVMDLTSVNFYPQHRLTVLAWAIEPAFKALQVARESSAS